MLGEFKEQEAASDSENPIKENGPRFHSRPVYLFL